MSTSLRSLIRHALPSRETADAEAVSAESMRVRIATSPDTAPEMLDELAADPTAEVRRALAGNDAAPAQVNVRLARDADVGVRTALAQKIARAVPRLAADARIAVHVAVLDVLETLARDQVPGVRLALAEALKRSDEAPGHVIGWLARDWNVAIAGPVLQSSPLLTDEDLGAMIANAGPGALIAIAARQDLSADIADAIVASGDRAAVAALLGNPSAAVHDATLDRLIDESRVIGDLQAPLVGRPGLPAAAAVRLASFVAGRALETLRARGDFDARTLAAIERVVSARFAGGARDEASSPSHPGAARARQLHEARRLDETAMMAALDDGDQAFIGEALALLAEVPAAVVARIRAARSGKGVTALAWKAGLTMRCAVRLQVRFGGIAAGDILNARDGIGFPMTRDEMEWMLDFFRN